MKWKRFFSCLLCGVLLLCGCTPAANSATTSHQLELVTTLFCYYDFARAILKDTDTIHLRLLLSPGMESHSFEPAPSDILAIQNADLFLYNGGHMEEWVSQVLDSDEQSHPDRIVRCMMDYAPLLEEVELEGSESEHDHDHEHDHDDHDHDHEGESEVEYDEHIWTSPANAMKLVEVITETLKEVSPENASYFEENKNSYETELKSLDDEFKDIVANGRHRMIVVADKFPFRYFAQEYGLSYRAAFSGCSTDTEPSAKTIAYLIDRIKENQIQAVFYLELSSHRTADIISEETGAKPLLLHSCHNVTRRQFDEGVTYLQLMKQNAKNLQEALL